jgi:hypothetical protein
MSTRAASWLAWPLAGLSVAIFVSSIPLVVLARSVHVPDSWGVDLSVGGVLGQRLFLVFPLVGALIASRRPHNPIGWILLADGFLWTLTGTADIYAPYGVTTPGSVLFPVIVAGINNWLWVPAVGLLGTYVFLLFPDGRLPSKRWRPLAWLSGAMIVSSSVGVMFTPGSLDNLGGMSNPFGLEGYSWLAVAVPAQQDALPLLPLCMLASALSLVLRYWHSRGEERQQIKWIAFAAALVALTYLIAGSAAQIHPSEAWTTAGSVWWLNLLTYATLLSFVTIPVAVGFAVLKYRLYDIDLLINRALVYGSLTVALAAVYFGGVVGTQAVFRTLTGQEQQPQFAVVASTMAIAALFNPLRRRIQSFIDRRFYRKKYDASKTLEAFSVKLRQETDLDALNEELLAAVGATVQPVHMSLWLHPNTVSKKGEAPDG